MGDIVDGLGRGTDFVGDIVDENSLVCYQCQTSTLHSASEHNYTQSTPPRFTPKWSSCNASAAARIAPEGLEAAGRNENSANCSQ